MGAGVQFGDDPCECRIGHAEDRDRVAAMMQLLQRLHTFSGSRQQARLHRLCKANESCVTGRIA